MGRWVRVRQGKPWRGAPGFAAAVLSVLAWGAPAAIADATVIGEQNLAPNMGSAAQLGQNIPVFQGDAGGGYVLSPTQAGTITSWSFLSGGVATGNHFELAVLAPVDQSGMNWRLIATSAPVAVTTATGADAVNGPFPVQIAIDAGDRIALMPIDDSSTPIETGTQGTDGIRYFSQPFNGGLGSSQQVASTDDNGQVVPIQATIAAPGGGGGGPAGAPVNTVPPAIHQAKSCVAFLSGRISCQPIPYNYSCSPGVWTGNDPAVPYNFEWQQAYSQRGSNGLQFTDWRTETAGQTFEYGPRFAGGSGVWRCAVTATGPGGSTVAYSKQQQLQGYLVISRGRHLRLFPSPVDIRVTGIEVTQGTQETPCAGCRFADPSHTICATCTAGTLPSRDQTDPSEPGLARYSGVTMAAGKNTVVRVFANFTDPDGSRALTSLAGATAQLEVTDSAGHRILPQPGMPLTAAFAPAALSLPVPACPLCVDLPTRANPGSSFYFLIPAQFTDHRSLSFHVTVTPQAGINQAGQCAGCRDNMFTLNGVPFKQAATLTIWPIPLEDDGVPGNPRTSLSLSQIFGSVQAVYPNPVRVLPWDGGLDVEALGQDDAVEAVEDRAEDNDLPSSVYPVGVFFKGLSNLANGLTIDSGTLFTDDGPPHSIVEDDRPLTSIGHEIGHGMALGHADNSTPHPDGTADCGGGANGQPGEGWAPDYEGRIQGVGLDLRGFNAAVPGSLPSTFIEGFDHQGKSAPGTKYYDFMSYCPPGGIIAGSVVAGQDTEPNDWLSPHNWQRLLDYHAPAQALPPAADLRARRAAARARAAQATGVRVIATVMPGGATTIHAVTPGGRVTQRPTPGSPFRIELRDAADNVLTSVVPATVPIHVDGVGQPQGLMLAASLPFPPTTAAAVITGSGQEMARRTRSAHAPAGRFVSPRAGTLVGRTGATVVRWTASDADGDKLTADVDYSADGGRSWRVVTSRVTESSARIPSRLLSASGNARLRVRISDGFNLTTVTSGRLRARGVPPVVEIIGTPARARVPETAMLPLQGSAFDDANRPLTGRRLRWYVGKRLIGSGEHATAHGLVPGNTVIRLIATDSHGRRAQATMRLRVTAVAARYLLFYAPLRVSPRARSVRITAAATLPATFTIAGKRFALGSRERTITVPIRPGRTLLVLNCSLRSPGGSIPGTYVAARGGG